jgi:hypothetical protein
MSRPGPAPSAVEHAAAFVRERGVVLVSARGRAPSLVEAIAGAPVAGSWWAHPEARHIFATLRAVTASEDILVCRLVGGKVTLVHRRLWPALARLAGRFRPEQIARVREEHTASGRHASRAIAFPEWVPAEVLQDAETLGEDEAHAAVGAWLPSSVRRHRLVPRIGG